LDRSRTARAYTMIASMTRLEDAVTSA